MNAPIDLKAEFAKLKMLEGRTPTSSEAERQGAFARLAPYPVFADSGILLSRRRFRSTG